jgi:hypothetical protein
LQEVVEQGKNLITIDSFSRLTTVALTKPAETLIAGSIAKRSLGYGFRPTNLIFKVKASKRVLKREKIYYYGHSYNPGYIKNVYHLRYLDSGKKKHKNSIRLLKNRGLFEFSKKLYSFILLKSMNMRKFSMRTTRFTLNKNRKFQFYLISL